MYINNPSCVISTFLVLLLNEKLSNVISVSGYSGDVLVTICFVNVLPEISEFTVPLSAANRGFSIENPLSSFIEPVRTSLIYSAATGTSALAPKLLYWPLPKKYSPYPFDAVYSAAGKNGTHPPPPDALYSALKYCR